MPSPPSSAADAAHRLRGISIYCCTMLAFAGLDASAKYAGRYVPALEVAWVRFLVHVALALLILRPWHDWGPYRTKRPLLQILRSLFLVGSTIFNFLALQSLQLDQTVSIAFSCPFLIAALAGPLLGEWAGPQRWIAIGIGFLGVLVIAMPGFGDAKPALLLSFGSAISYAFYIILTRMLSPTESSASMLLLSAVVPAIALAPVAVPVSVLPPTLIVVLCLFLTGFCGLFGHWCVILAHKLAPAPVLAPFMYTQIIWMILLGYLVFGDVPAPRTLAGTGIIVASGLYLLYRESRNSHGRLTSTLDDA
ncbi:EamA family transporter [Kaistia algarum]|uniref:DMT family transporter n=1 Tax=Kaistia algarum TaxID=2083279 RepID=UPI000CE8D813|nr:DMT family transporter [Kaistia algarum]MCX5514168.1 DMT family transporter [Kaistia algarum]PPE77929.1 EamA family transporter [Kaistia algarum]